MAKRFENNAEIRRLLGDLRSELIPKRVRVNRSLGPSLEMILRPAINFAIMRLQRRTQRHIGAFLTCGAWDSLARYLVSVLENALLPTYRIMESATRAAVFAGNWKSDCQRKRCFNRGMSFLEMVKRFPGTAEVLAQLIFDWIESQHEMICRLYRDRKLLRALFSKRRRQEFRVSQFLPGLSDPHDRGRSVTVIKFQDGQRVVYKPRSTDGEHIWFGALHWMNRQGFSAKFKIPEILARSRYFWMTFLRPRDCSSFEAVRGFYFRWGAQAAVAQILRAQDLHRENWIAAGSQPILVDAEMASDLNSTRSPSSRSSKWGNLHPLLRTGLLPIYHRDGVGFYSGIAPFDQAAIARGENIIFWPRYAHRFHPPLEYIEDLVSGYQAAFRFIGSHQREQKFFSRMARLTRRRKQRILLRATAEYCWWLRESYSAKNMLSPNERLKLLKRMCRTGPKSRKARIAEAEALSHGCVPRFAAASRLRQPDYRMISVRDLASSTRLFRSRVLRPL